LTDGGNYSGATTNTLSIKDVTSLNAKKYKLKARNNGCPSAWVVSKEAVLTVNPTKLDFTGHQPTGVTACLGTGCSFTSYPANADEYQWQMNDEDLKDGGVFSGVKTGKLTISDVTFLGGNYFKLKAKNNDCPSWVSSQAVSLAVPQLPDFKDHQPENATACAGTSYNFVSVPTKADTYQWLENGVDLTETAIYKDVTTTTLKITDVTGLNGKIYTLKAKNMGCPPEWVSSLPATLTVTPLPDFTGRDPQNSTTCVGSNTLFLSLPENADTYQWQENSVDLTNTGVYSGVTTTTLNISNVIGLNGKQYRLKAKKQGCPSAWKISNNATLTVPTEPNFTGKHPRDTTVNTGTSYNFVSAPSNTNQYQWQENGGGF